MSARDPQAMSPLPKAYPASRMCAVDGCGHDELFHALNDRRTARTTCSAWGCDCAKFQPGPVAEEKRCPTCHAHWDAIEAARLDG